MSAEGPAFFLGADAVGTYVARCETYEGRLPAKAKAGVSLFT